MNAAVHPLPLGSRSPFPARADRDWVTGHELTAEAGISYRRGDYWTRTGLLTPLDERRPGPGHIRRYALDQVDRAIAIRQLLDAGVSLTTIRSHIDDYLATGRIVLGPLTIARTTN